MAHNLKGLTAFWGIFLTIILNPSLSAVASPSKGSRSSQTARAPASETPSKGALSAIELKAPASARSLEQEAPFSPLEASANSALPRLPADASMPPVPTSSASLNAPPLLDNPVKETPLTVEGEDNVATLGMLDRTQQEILLLQSQIELDKLKQQLSQLSQPKFGNDYSSVSTVHLSKSKASEENIILIYSVNGKKRVRLQVNGRYPLDLEEGQSLSGGEKIISIGENEILLEDGQGYQRLLSMI